MSNKVGDCRSLKVPAACQCAEVREGRQVGAAAGRQNGELSLSLEELAGRTEFLKAGEEGTADRSKSSELCVEVRKAWCTGTVEG